MMLRSVLLLVLILAMSTRPGLCQEKDTASNKITDSKIAREIIEAVTVRKNKELTEKNTKSENPFQQYQGKIIRYITVRQINFERSIYDTTKSIRNTVTHLANKLHSDTRQGVIRNHLFFQENWQINPYLLADNERYLRDLTFILDSKITVIPIPGNADSVDVEVMTRDVFSLGGRVRLGGVDKFSIGVYDANLAGRGQRVQADFLFENERYPFVGKGLMYTKSSVGGSLINVTAAYTELDNGRSWGEENEYAFYFRLDRPLVSPYSRMAGGIEISENWSRNVFNYPDSLFRDYKYNAQDFWVGYNIGVKNNVDDRSRHFVAIRYAQQHFERQPLQEGERLRRIYNDNRFLLGEVFFYEQNFYKTNYIYGFGRTEDVPYGQVVNITAGWTEELGLQRPYLGAFASRRIVRPSGRFYDLEIGAGTFFNKGSTEDGVMYLKGAYFSKLYDVRRSKMRHVFTGSLARAFNNRVRELLTLNRELAGFSADSLFGTQRISLKSETVVFTRYQLFGFRIAPFISLEAAYFNKQQRDVIDDKMFWGANGGFRIRNENLIFGTIEFRAFYFPVTVPGVESLSFKVTTNVRIKYSGSFVRPPDFVRYN
jgi:hypothetical protein